MTKNSLRMLAGAAVLSLGAAAALPLAAQAADQPASGTVVMTAKAAAIGVGYTWGDGTLNYKGHAYHFAVKGLTIADVGYASVVSRGHVYGLKNLHDFDGTYAAVTGEATLVKGVGAQILRNGNGVEIHVDETTKGARLAASADGIELTLK